MSQKLIITIERQYGSGGRIVGKMLSEELGIPYYDEEILKMTSEQSAIGEQYFRLADEKAGNKLLYKIVGGLKSGLDTPKIGEKMTSPDNLFRFQSEVIRKLAESESCIFIGRCADFVLEGAGVENVIRLFVYADTATKINRVMEVDDVDTKEALKRVQKINKERGEYRKYYTGENWEDANNYDLTINASKISYEQMASLIKEYIKIRQA